MKNNNNIFEIFHFFLCVFLFVFCSVASASKSASNEEKVYTFLGPGDVGGYTRALLDLALKKSEYKYGPYSLRFAPKMNEARALKSMQDSAYPRPIRRFETRTWTLNHDSIRPVPFPVYLGIFGYRICFVSEENAQGFAESTEIEDVKKFNHGLMSGWRDTEILRHNDFDVREGPSRKSLYSQVSLNRVDLFCRGAVEIPDEKPIFEKIDNLVLDETKAFFYPFPFFYYTQAGDDETAKRLEYGLSLAFEDGSVTELWNKFHRVALEKAELDTRKIIELENPITDHISFSYRQYLHHPIELGL